MMIQDIVIIKELLLNPNPGTFFAADDDDDDVVDEDEDDEVVVVVVVLLPPVSVAVVPICFIDASVVLP